MNIVLFIHINVSCESVSVCVCARIREIALYTHIHTHTHIRQPPGKSIIIRRHRLAFRVRTVAGPLASHKHVSYHQLSVSSSSSCRHRHCWLPTVSAGVYAPAIYSHSLCACEWVAVYVLPLNMLGPPLSPPPPSQPAGRAGTVAEHARTLWVGVGECVKRNGGTHVHVVHVYTFCSECDADVCQENTC